MMSDRYHFEEKLKMKSVGTAPYEEALLSTEPDEKIAARRKARREKLLQSREQSAREPAAAVREAPPRKKRTVHWGRVTVAVLLCAAIIGFVLHAGLKFAKLQIEKRQAQKELATLNMKLDQLTDELTALDSDEYVENSARSNLHMIKNGEVMYIVNPELGGEESSSDGAKPE